jgi:hypothetical protein
MKILISVLKNCPFVSLKKKFYIGLVLFLLGMLGMLSLLTVDFPLPEEMLSLLENQFTPSQIQLLILINPTILMLIAIVVGTILYQKVYLSVPIIEKWVGLREDKVRIVEIFVYGIVGGLVSGMIIGFLGAFSRWLIPLEFDQMGESLQLTLAARFLYGGITEEILMRFGLMTLLVWVASKLFKEPIL